MAGGEVRISVMRMKPEGLPLLIGYDGSSCVRNAIEVAGTLWPGRAAIVFYAWRPVSAPAATRASLRVSQSTEKDARCAALSIAEGGAALARQAGLAAHAEVAEGRPSRWEAVLQAADRADAGAVVVGGRGKTGFESTMLGSVSHGVVGHSLRPVLIVP